jgi:hypothetical protein
VIGNNPPEFYVFPEPYAINKNVNASRIKGSRSLPATVIMGYESIKHLNYWMVERSRLLRKYDLDPNDPEGYVFCATQNIKKTGVKVGDEAGIKAIGNAVYHVKKALGMRDGVKFHSWRNNHTTNLISGGMPELFVLVLQGRKGQAGSIRDYTDPDREQLLEFYKRAYHVLALDTKESEVVKSLSETVKQQDEENKALTLRIDWLEDFIQGLKEEEQKKPAAFPNLVRTLGFSRNGETQFIHPKKGVYKITYGEEQKETEQVDPLDAILADPELRERLAEKIRKGEF